MTRKTFTIVGENDYAENFAVSSEAEFDRILGQLRAVRLKDVESGEVIVGFPSLESGKAYTSITMAGIPYPAPLPSFTSKNRAIRGPPTSALLQQLPRSPPRNGLPDVVKLERRSLIDTVMERANPLVILRSPPGTGKTSLLELMESELNTRENTKVVRIMLRDGIADSQLVDGLMEELLGYRKSAFLNFNVLTELNADTWILFDDAQLAFQNKGFWKVVMKDFETASRKARNIHIVIAATYDLTSQGSTPYHFGEYHHVVDFQLTKDEAEQLYDQWIDNIYFADGWIGFKDTLLRLAGGHAGVISGGISMILQIHKSRGNQMSETDALKALRDGSFNVYLGRCFPCSKLMDSAQRCVIANRILSASNSDTTIDFAEDSTELPVLVELVRCGVLSSSANFSCLAAQWRYFNNFYRRPTSAPKSIEDLVVQAVESLSALRLRQSCSIYKHGRFPKEAAFQQLFTEAFTLLLPTHLAVYPELNTFAKDSAGNVVTGELDFYIDGDLGWAIELLRQGEKINEHVQRFDPENGKYRFVGHKDHLVVDCRGPRTRSVEPMQSRCTLYFSSEFDKVEIQMRNQPSTITIGLND